MKKYTLEITEKNSKLNMSSTNNGFNVFELLGFLEAKKVDLIEQLKGEIIPDIEYTRKVTKDEPKTECPFDE